jgi:hypothetical protein
LRYDPFSAADEKIPLSVVQVNNKPPYLVFCSHSQHLFSKQRRISVESVNSLSGRWLSRAALHPTPGKPEFLPTATSMNKVSLRRDKGQEAETVQFGRLPVRVVEIKDASSEFGRAA